MRANEIILPRSLIFHDKLDKIREEVAQKLDAGEYTTPTLNLCDFKVFASQITPKEYKGQVCFTHNKQGKVSIEFPEFQDHPVLVKVRDKFIVIDGHHRCASAVYHRQPITVYLVDLPDNT